MQRLGSTGTLVTRCGSLGAVQAPFAIQRIYSNAMDAGTQKDRYLGWQLLLMGRIAFVRLCL